MATLEILIGRLIDKHSKKMFLAGGIVAVFSFFITLSIKEEKFMRGAKAKILHRHRIIKRRICKK